MVEDQRKAILKQLITESADIAIRADGIMHVHVKIELDFKLEHSMEIVAARTQLAAGRPFPILYTATTFVIPTSEVRQYVASEDRSELVLADAFVINSLPQRITAKLYRVINRPVRPTRIFENEMDAIEWLKGFVVKTAPDQER